MVLHRALVFYVCVVRGVAQAYRPAPGPSSRAMVLNRAMVFYVCVMREAAQAYRPAPGPSYRAMVFCQYATQLATRTAAQAYRPPPGPSYRAMVLNRALVFCVCALRGVVCDGGGEASCGWWSCASWCWCARGGVCGVWGS
jgi:hypothetical protein